VRFPPNLSASDLIKTSAINRSPKIWWESFRRLISYMLVIIRPACLRVRQSVIVYTVLLLSHTYAVCTRGRPASSLKAAGVDDLDCVVSDDVVVQLNDGHVGEHWPLTGQLYIIQFTNNASTKNLTSQRPARVVHLHRWTAAYLWGLAPAPPRSSDPNFWWWYFLPFY